MKWMLWLSRMVASAVIISGISVFTVWYAVNEQVEGLLKQLNIVPPERSFDLQDYLSELSKQAALFIPNMSGTGTTDSASETDSSQLPLSRQSGSSTPQPSESPDDGALPVWSQIQQGIGESGKANAGHSSSQAGGQYGTQSGGQAGAGQQDEIVMSEDQFNEKREKLNSEDRMRIFSLLSAKLPEDEFLKITSFVENGITQQELKEIDAIVSRQLSPQEYSELKQIIRKY